MGDNTGAIRDLTEAIRHDPKNVDAYRYRSHALARQGEYSRAGSDHDAYVRLSEPAGPGAAK
jgi:Tfp pilus assembly protein PilF